MEECYVLLGISPAATTEEIEQAYLDKKREFAPDRFEQGSEEWQRASSMLEELDKAYNDAIMATFAPIKAFTASAPPPSPASIHSPSYGKRPESAPVKVAVNLDDLVEEVPVSFSDEQLLSMDIGQLRESYESSQEKFLLLTWGIEDKLLRHYVMAYVGFVIMNLMIVFSLGGHPSFTIQSLWGRHHAGQMERAANVLRDAGAVGTMHPGMAQHFADAAQQMTEAARQMTTTVVQPSALMLILMAFVTTGYYFLCSLPMPIITRFIIMGQPASETVTRWVLYSLSITAAVVLHSLTGWLIGNWAGSVLTLAFVAVLLCSVTVQYEGS